MFRQMFRKTDYIPWSVYRERVDFLDTFRFQQRTRKESIRNSFFY